MKSKEETKKIELNNQELNILTMTLLRELHIYVLNHNGKEHKIIRNLLDKLTK